MSNTVKMKKGNKVYDIYDSPETIANAEKEGLTLVNEEPLKEEKKDTVEKIVEKPVVEKVNKTETKVVKTK